MTFMFLLKAAGIGAAVYLGTGFALIGTACLLVWLFHSRKVLANLFAWLIVSGIAIVVFTALGISILKGKV